MVCLCQCTPPSDVETMSFLESASFRGLQPGHSARSSVRKTKPVLSDIKRTMEADMWLPCNRESCTRVQVLPPSIVAKRSEPISGLREAISHPCVVLRKKRSCTLPIRPGIAPPPSSQSLPPSTVRRTMEWSSTEPAIQPISGERKNTRSTPRTSGSSVLLQVRPASLVLKKIPPSTPYQLVSSRKRDDHSKVPGTSSHVLPSSNVRASLNSPRGVPQQIQPLALLRNQTTGEA